MTIGNVFGAIENKYWWDGTPPACIWSYLFTIKDCCIKVFKNLKLKLQVKKTKEWIRIESNRKEVRYKICVDRGVEINKLTSWHDNDAQIYFVRVLKT